jgi:hypothetical protein
MNGMIGWSGTFNVPLSIEIRAPLSGGVIIGSDMLRILLQTWGFALQQALIAPAGRQRAAIIVTLAAANNKQSCWDLYPGRQTERNSSKRRVSVRHGR